MKHHQLAQWSISVQLIIDDEKQASNVVTTYTNLRYLFYIPVMNYIIYSGLLIEHIKFYTF